MKTSPVKPKLASGPRDKFTGSRAFVTRSLAAESHQENATRCYDFASGRGYVSPDTIVQFPYSSQGTNRYAYVNNNPLSHTDPTGHSLKRLRKAVQNIARVSVSAAVAVPAAAAKAVYQVHVQAYKYAKDKVDYNLQQHQWARTALMAASAFCGPAAGYCAAAASTYIAHVNDASNQDALKAGLRTYVSSEIMSTQATGAHAPWYEQALAHGVQSGIATSVQGGNFSDGFRQGAQFSTMESWTDYLARKSGLTATDPDTGKLRTDGGRVHCETCNRSIFKNLGMGMEGGGDHWYENIPGVRNLIVDVSKVHDTMNSWRYSWDSGQFLPFNNVVSDSLFDVYSFAGMLPAASFTLKAPPYGLPAYGTSH